MKKIILSFLLLLFAIVAHAQNNKYLVDEYGNPKHYSVGVKYSKCNIFLVVDSGTKHVTPFEYLNNFPSGNIVLLKGAKSIEIESRIQKDSLSFYRYSIIQNDSIVIKKDAIPTEIKYRWGSGSILPNYVAADLGIFNAVNKKIEVQIYRTDLKTRVTSVIIYNKPIFASKSLSFKLLGENSVRSINNNTSLAVNGSVKGIRVSMENTDINALYSVVIENLDSHSSTLLNPKWKRIKLGGMVIADIGVSEFKLPGRYRVSVYPETSQYASWINNKLSRDFLFTTLKPRTSLFTQKQLIIYGLILCAIFGAIFGAAVTYIKRKEAQKLALKHRDKEMARIQLASVRSQLNPHFLFNALAGIQMLMNKNETDKANRYLSKFARLTRNVLENKELISLTAEKTLLDDYLQMEQLRFGFQYKISASADLDTENIEIPAMLLQPFVENAVKHGVAEKGNAGQIEINFIKQGTDLVLRMADNGSGFDTSKNYDGLGLALSKNRVSLLNSIYKETPFVLDIQSGHSGTTVNITLTQWL
ncbi:sensor histidine kinase [Pedobacter kyungheensis]|uniref:sensor histidine kinase n=1 Tax=Pedobacter kyungheensis TaxID=1069985 RepID=UPI0012E0AC1E|nr:histidine kinase [Pedobacter kyungheensis]